MTDLNEQSFNLTYLDRFKIENEAEGLSEPSGLALSHGKNALWTVSDDTRRIFKLSLDGELKKDDSFDIPDTGLEGITLDPSRKVPVHGQGKRQRNHQNRDRRRRGHVTDNAFPKWRVMTQSRPIFPVPGSNKGLEGITWNTGTGTLFVMKEGEPGLLMEVSPDLKAITAHQVLNAENGFRDSEVAADEVDFSDLCYDWSRDRLWIISDKARRLFLYDWKRNTVIQSAKLGYGKGGEYREIEKAEGVTIDPDANCVSTWSATKKHGFTSLTYVSETSPGSLHATVACG